jgi:uncharacterized protein YndB with AHSA1/START domain
MFNGTQNIASAQSSDRIEKGIVLRAPRARVWRALADANEFGQWFRVKPDGPFVEGKTVRGQLLNPDYAHITLEMQIERVEPERYFAYRWHPYAIEAGVDYSKEPTTLVEFQLEDQDGGTLLTVVESGFDRIPLARRAEAFRMNDRGWAQQLTNIERHVA